ncbi:MAG: adenosylcobinamide-GDP ribazoletransferase [Bacillota bacterium]|nr:adenosylcobinamide-GDP ribazoletransferase [Bacillota bacterium]
MIYLKRFILMLQFFTRIPIPLKLQVQTEDFGKGLVFAPVIGLVIGGILGAAYHFLSCVFPFYASVIITVIIYIVLTGGLHLDGLGDTFDGLFSGRSKDKMLEIMRDSRLGTNALLSVISVLALNTALLISFDKGNVLKVIILMPVAGRIGSLVGAGISKYARSGEGLGKSFIDYCGTREILIGIIPYLAIFYLMGQVNGLAAGIAAAIFPVLVVKALSKKIGGATGDVLGAVCELNQTIFLVLVYLMQFKGYIL